MLRIPTSTDNPQPLVVPVNREVPKEPVTAENPVKSGKRRRKKPDGTGDQSWEHTPTSSRGRRGEQRRMRMMLICGSLLFLVIVAGVMVSLLGQKARVVAPPLDKPPAAPAGETVKALPTDAELVSEAEPLARKFLHATTVEGILPLVRNPEVAESRIRRFYPGGKIDAPGLSGFNSGAGLVTRGSLHSFPVQTRDHREMVLAFVETPQGLRIDWESWVGWSDMPWEEFISTKPVTSHVFRVVLTPVEYYNFGFSDDLKWQSYRLESPDNEHAVYGYVERNSPLYVQIRPDADGLKVSLTLALKFPPDAKSGNQVEIERFVCNGWVEEGATP